MAALLVLLDIVSFPFSRPDVEHECPILFVDKRLRALGCDTPEPGLVAKHGAAEAFTGKSPCCIGYSSFTISGRDRVQAKAFRVMLFDF